MSTKQCPWCSTEMASYATVCRGCGAVSEKYGDDSFSARLKTGTIAASIIVVPAYLFGVSELALIAIGVFFFVAGFINVKKSERWSR